MDTNGRETEDRGTADGGAQWTAASLARPTGVATPVLYRGLTTSNAVRNGCVSRQVLFPHPHRANGKRYGTAVPTAVGLASEAALHGMPAFICGFT
jgi:hypothetical protein